MNKKLILKKLTTLRLRHLRDNCWTAPNVAGHSTQTNLQFMRETVVPLSTTKSSYLDRLFFPYCILQNLTDFKKHIMRLLVFLTISILYWTLFVVFLKLIYKYKYNIFNTILFEWHNINGYHLWKILQPLVGNKNNLSLIQLHLCGY